MVLKHDFRNTVYLCDCVWLSKQNTQTEKGKKCSKETFAIFGIRESKANRENIFIILTSSLEIGND